VCDIEVFITGIREVNNTIARGIHFFMYLHGDNSFFREYREQVYSRTIQFYDEYITHKRHRQERN
jgi:hypothetical protein